MQSSSSQGGQKKLGQTKKIFPGINSTDSWVSLQIKRTRVSLSSHRKLAVLKPYQVFFKYNKIQETMNLRNSYLLRDT